MDTEIRSAKRRKYAGLPLPTPNTVAPATSISQDLSNAEHLSEVALPWLSTASHTCELHSRLLGSLMKLYKIEYWGLLEELQGLHQQHVDETAETEPAATGHSGRGRLDINKLPTLRDQLGRSASGRPSSRSFGFKRETSHAAACQPSTTPCVVACLGSVGNDAAQATKSSAPDVVCGAAPHAGSSAGAAADRKSNAPNSSSEEDMDVDVLGVTGVLDHKQHVPRGESGADDTATNNGMAANEKAAETVQQIERPGSDPHSIGQQDETDQRCKAGVLRLSSSMAVASTAGRSLLPARGLDLSGATNAAGTPSVHSKAPDAAGTASVHQEADTQTLRAASCSAEVNMAAAQDAEQLEAGVANRGRSAAGSGEQAGWEAGVKQEHGVSSDRSGQREGHGTNVTESGGSEGAVVGAQEDGKALAKQPVKQEMGIAGETTPKQEAVTPMEVDVKPLKDEPPSSVAGQTTAYRHLEADAEQRTGQQQYSEVQAAKSRQPAGSLMRERLTGMKRGNEKGDNAEAAQEQQGEVAGVGQAGEADTEGTSRPPTGGCERAGALAAPGHAPGLVLEAVQALVSAHGDEVRGYGSDDEPALYSDVEEHILEGNSSGTQVLPLLNEWQRKFHHVFEDVVRLEQLAAHASTVDMDSKDALACLSGRGGRYLIKRSTVSLGRCSDRTGTVDVDLSLEGQASKVSRQQADITCTADGSFYITNLGRRYMHVNNVLLQTGEGCPLPHLSLIEVGGIRLLFSVNHHATARIVRRTTNMSM